MKRLLFFFVLCSFFNLHSQTLVPGQIIDSVVVPGTTDETFAVYLPSSYDASKPSSVVFIFDPAARGKIGVGAFLDVAETYGHILVCSNSSKNGPYGRNFGIAERLFNHVFSILYIDENSIYLAGFSGGSRLASAIASLTNKIEGVVGCGAGFSGVSAHTPSAQNYSYVGLCGDRDMNYSEMLAVKEYLQQIGFNHTLITYNGNHSWPPSKELLKAFGWLEVESHKKGHLVIDQNELKKGYEKNYVEARKLESEENNLSLAVEEYIRILNTYGAIYDLDSIQGHLKQLQKKKAYKHLVKAADAALKKEKELSDVLIDRFNKDYAGSKAVNLAWWEKELKKLNENGGQENIEAQKMVDRVKSKIGALAYSKNNPSLFQSNKRQRDFCSALLKIIYPNYGVH